MSLTISSIYMYVLKEIINFIIKNKDILMKMKPKNDGELNF